MYLMVTSLYPADKAKDAANTYVKMMAKYPDDTGLMTPLVQCSVKTTLEGIHITHISEVKKGKLEDALEYAIKRMTMFYDIPGYKWQIETPLNIDEALKTIGM